MSTSRLVLVPLLASALSGCAALAGDPITAETAAPSRVKAAPLPQPVSVTACVDGTRSLRRDVVQQSKDVIASAVASWPATGRDRALPALEVRVRRIDSRSYADGEVLRRSVPAVPAPVREPAPDDPAFVAALDLHEASVAVRPGQLKAAQAAAQATAAAIRSLDLAADASEIGGCVSAAAESMGSSASRRIIVWSDLIQTGEAQISGDLRGISVLVIQVCGSDVAQCTASRKAFLATVAVRGGGAKVVRPERASSVLLRFLRTGEA